MKSHWVKKLSWVSIIVIISMCGATLLPDYQEAYAAQKELDEKIAHKEEIVDLRTENSRTYVKGDNSYEVEEYLEPIHYQEKGQWKEIDNNVETVKTSEAMESSLRLENKANEYRVGFADNSQAGHLVRFQLDDAFVRFGVVDGRSVTATKQENEVTYVGVYPDTDLVYHTGSTGVKEEWVLHKSPEQNTLSMKMDTHGVEAKKQKDGSINFVDAKGKTTFSIPRPYMIDKDLRYSGDVQYEIRQEGDITYLDLQLDEKWLKDPERAYPVSVDPSIVMEGAAPTKDTFVGTKEPTTSYGALTYLTVGNNPDHGTSRAFLKFHLESLLSGASISSAKLSLYETNADTTAAIENVYPVTGTWPSPFTWESQPAIGKLLTSQTIKGAGWYDFDLTSLTKEWYSGQTANEGVSLRHKTESENRKSYFSSDYTNDLTKLPKLTVQYNIEPLGQEAFWTTTASNVNTYNGNFFVPETDINVPGRGVAGEISRSYNSRANQAGIFGYGWTSNLEQRLTDSGDGPIRYTDGDGTVHVFALKSDGSYVSPPGLNYDLEKSGSDYNLTTPDDTVLQFDSTGHLVKITDSNKNVMSIQYTDGTPTTITDASGRTIGLTYNSDHRVVKASDPAKRTTEYGYDSDGNLTTVTKKDAAGKELVKTTYGYDASHNMTSMQDPNGNKRSVEYDSQDRVSQFSQPLTVDGEKKEATNTYSYDALNKITTVKNPKGTPTVYTHNEYGNVVQITQDPNGLNQKQSFTYNDQNELINEKDANANAKGSSATYNYTYDENGNLTSVTNPLGEKSTTEYDDNNNPIKETDAKGNTTTTEYDEDNNPTSTTDALEKSSAQKYDSDGNLTKETAMMSPGQNLAPNGSFELDKSDSGWPDGWYQTTDSGDKPVSWSDTGLSVEGVTLGKKKMEIVDPKEDTIIGISEKIPYDAKQTYIASGYVETKDAKGIAGIQATGYDKDGKITLRIKSNEISGTQGPTRPHAVVEPGAFPSTTTEFRIRAYAFDNDGKREGTYRFDGLQVEEGYYGAYNLIENGGLERNDDPVDDIPDRWYLAGDIESADGLDSTQQHEGSTSVKLTGNASKWKTLRQDLPIQGKAGTTLTVSGFSKVSNPDPNGGIYGYVIETYKDGLLGSSKQETFALNFDKSKSHDWQHQAEQIKTTKDFDKVIVYYEYSKQAGTAWFDTAKVFPGSVTTTYQYDDKGNYETKSTDPEGRTSESTYDAVGNVTSEKQGSDTTGFAYDGLNRLTKVTDAKGKETSYTYDANGNKTKVTNARGKETTTTYNEMDQVSKITDALGKSVLFAYDLNGNQTKMTQPNGDTVSTSYDAVDRPSSVSYNGAKKYSFGYDANGNITKETDEAKNESTTFTYDADNKLTTVTELNNNQTDYTYDKNGNVTERKLTAGSTSITQGYGYDANDQLTQVKEDGKNRARYTYDENDRIASRKNEDGTVSLYHYNGAGDLTQQVILGTDGEERDSLTYTYDAKGNITQVKSSQGTTSYAYDALEQLTKETLPDGTVTSYTYDATGNRLTKTVTKDGNSTTTNYTYDDADQMTQVNGKDYTYDKNGNLIDDGKRTYTYDAENRLTAVKEGAKTLASYTYRADGMRKSMTTDSGTLVFHYDEDNNVTYETDKDGKVVASYTYGANGELVSMTRDGKAYYYETNYRGDVTALTDSNGEEVASYEYDTFGNLVKKTGDVENPYRYAGYRYDEVTGLYYLQSRYYSAEAGRFLTRDTFKGFENDPLSMNQYTYSFGNPVMYMDPDGHYAAVAVYFIPGIGEVAMLVSVAALLGYGAYYLYTKRGPVGRANRKKQGREVNEKKRKNKDFKSRSNKKPNREMKKHTPSRSHRRKR
ncbi:DNRLRE domain-containing protein [Marininema halotolerans]|uniref:RHS repeat-associated core domain-containing protein n=1 Tax=Marininema halotolerans TaxID=1155944 RepID=A0A1I6SHL8_9BACL|nr:DNRLRE domain-containing protein [Marininema halotolerans]SFS76370.1 RHS repeat-associated core domain-containing protein [Marininema halotolerans]